MLGKYRRQEQVPHVPARENAYLTNMVGNALIRRQFHAQQFALIFPENQHKRQRAHIVRPRKRIHLVRVNLHTSAT